MKKYFELFWTFFKLGLFTFGGGYAMIPQIKEIVVEKKKWATLDDVLEIIAIAESTPGPIAINMATYIGYKQGKFLGSVCSTLGVVLPSLIIIYIISLFFEQFLSLVYVQYAFVGIKCAVAFLIIKAGIGMFNKMKKNILNLVLFFFVLSLLILFELTSISFSSIFLIIVGGIIGIIANSIISHKKMEENKWWFT